MSTLKIIWSVLVILAVLPFSLWILATRGRMRQWPRHRRPRRK